MAAACYPVYRMAADAEVAIEVDGRVFVRCGTQDLGTGTSTILARLAADALGMPVDRVDIGDTALPEGPYSGGAHVTASVTPAVEQAARALRRRVIEIPVHANMPRFDVAFVDDEDPHLAGGVKGVGMIGTA